MKNKTLVKVLKWASTATMGIALFGLFGTICMTWFYEPPLAARFTLDK